MEGIPSGPVEEEYPVIETDVEILWKAPAHTTGMVRADSVTTVRDVFVDEDGVTQVAVVDTHTNTPNGRHTISIQDLYERMTFQDYDVIS
jgi:hypothetical protein